MTTHGVKGQIRVETDILARELRETAYVVQGYVGIVRENVGHILEKASWRCQKSLDCLERLVQSWELVQTDFYQKIELKKIRVNLTALVREEADKCEE